MKVLISDDDPTVRSELQELLEGLGHRVETAGTGDEVLRRVAAERYDIILLDWRMPGPSGEALVRRAKEIRPDAAIIVMTGYGDVDTAVEAFRSGAADFLRKPFEFEAVQRAFEGARRAIRQSANRPRGGAPRRPSSRRSAQIDIRAAFLNYRNGTLVGHRVQAREQIIDEDILTGMLDAIQNFMRTAFPVLRGKRLRAIVQGDHTLLIERGQYVYLSLIVRGPDSEGLRRRMRARLRAFETRNEDALRKWHGDSSDAQGIDEVLSPFIG